MIRQRTLGLLVFVTLAAWVSPSLARDMAFVDPGSSVGSATPDEAFKIEPKSEIDIGDSIINIVRRETLFFVNQTSAPIKIEKVTLSNDSTVSPLITNDDCSKQSTIAPLSRCSIELSITPTGPGAWSIELLITHNGPGRISRAKIDGKTAGSDVGDKHDRGLFLSSKDSKPIDFGEVTVGDGKVVRSALMVNDSPSPITIYSIDVIEADKTLQRIEQGCAVDMDLKPGESCPVTLVWSPTTHGLISTDLIIRHSGQLGFAVIPVRGSAKGTDTKEPDTTTVMNRSPTHPDTNPIPPPPSPADVAKEVAKAAIPVSSQSLSPHPPGNLHLIGTVGTHAVLLKPDGTTVVVQTGDQVDLGGSTPAKVDSISAHDAVLIVDGKKKTLPLEAAQELKDKAMASKAEEDGNKSPGASGNGTGGGSFGLGGGTQ